MITQNIKFYTDDAETFNSRFPLVELAKNKITRVIFILTFSLMGCNEQSHNQLLIEKLFLSDTKIGSVAKLNSLGIDATESVCSLQPYQDLIHDDYPERLRVNEHLRQIDYIPSEGYWALVLVKKTSIELLKIKRSKKSDFASFNMENSLFPQPPSNFEVVGCAFYEEAALFKTQLDNRVYFLFGRTK